MENKKTENNKTNVENILIILLFFSFLLLFLFFENISTFKKIPEKHFEQHIIKQQLIRKEKRIKILKNDFDSLKERGCLKIKIDENICEFEKEKCFELDKIPEKIFCEKWNMAHIKKPKILKTLYYTSYAANSERKLQKLFSFMDNTEINSVVIDIKEVDGKVAFDMSDFSFGKIRPISQNIFKNPKKLIERLHKKGIYVIGRIVVFKDKNLAERRPDLALQNIETKKVWTDRSGKKYLDPNAKEVWDYTVNLARAIYLTGFDEINFDYIRYPSDGSLNKIKFPFSEEEILKDPKWGRAKVIDKFFNYLTTNLRKEFPEIQLSADLFGYIAITNDDLKIGQLLESGILYFDRVGPMTYPSHYNKHFLGLASADSNPYVVIKETMKRISKKIDRLNLEIESAKKENRKIFLKKNFPASIEVENVKEISKDKVMIWLQGFDCTWCGEHIHYGKAQIQAQSRASKEQGYNSWFIWNAASRYGNWFKK